MQLFSQFYVCLFPQQYKKKLLRLFNLTIQILIFPNCKFIAHKSNFYDSLKNSDFLQHFFFLLYSQISGIFSQLFWFSLVSNME